MVRATKLVVSVISMVAVVVSASACSGSQTSTETDPVQPSDSEYTVPVEVVVTTPPPQVDGSGDAEPDVIVADEPVSSQVAVVVTEPNPDGIMPDVLCMDLQDAQDLIQTRGVFFSRSEDASGEGRRQILDRNWIVVAQTPAAGEPIGEGDALLSVLKDEEVSECTPGVGGS